MFKIDSSANNRVMGLWLGFKEFSTSSQEMILLHWLAGGAFFATLVLSLNYLNPPLRLDQLEVHEGALVEVRARGRSSCGDELIIRSEDGELMSFRARINNPKKLNNPAIFGEGKRVKVWVQYPWYSFFCFKTVSRAHQIEIDGRMVESYGDDSYLRRVSSYGEKLKWWVGVPFSIGVLSVFGILVTARRDRKLASKLTDKQGD